jgi:hypothetical protein
VVGGGGGPIHFGRDILDMLCEGNYGKIRKINPPINVK